MSSGVQYFLAIWWYTDWAHSAAVNGWCLRTRRRRYQRLVHQRGRRRFFWKSARAYDYALSRAAKTKLLQSVILLCALLFYCVWFSLLSIELTEAVCAIVYVYVVVCVDGSCIVKAFRKLEAVQIWLRSCYNHQNRITSSLLFYLPRRK